MKTYLKATVTGVIALAVVILAQQVQISANNGELGILFAPLMPVASLLGGTRIPLLVLPVAVLFGSLLFVSAWRKKYGMKIAAALTIGVVQLVVYGFILANKDDVVWSLVPVTIALVEAILIGLVLLLSSRIRGADRN